MQWPHLNSKWVLNFILVFTILSTAAVSATVQIENCSTATKQALEKSNMILKIADKLWSPSGEVIRSRLDKISIDHVDCVKWIENDEVLHITVHYLKNGKEETTALLSLFGDSVSVNEKPIGSFENLLGTGLVNIKKNGKDTQLVLEDLNKDNRPEIIFVMNGGLAYRLFAFQVDLKKKILDNIDYKVEVDDEVELETHLALRPTEANTIELKKYANATVIETPTSRFSVHNNYWIEEKK